MSGIRVASAPDDTPIEQIHAYPGENNEYMKYLMMTYGLCTYARKHMH
jgi:hypothetical protein